MSVGVGVTVGVGCGCRCECGCGNAPIFLEGKVPNEQSNTECITVLANLFKETPGE